ncbi:MAG TPA: YbaB/EbfC family nucleoid-associated protein [Candidatus Hydrogenedentes bacterium]|nr:YbaB/EbfC family nucleoid-associated protein [Candidatus Hydrogenedentota bacterium]HOT50715.1 YbaB/EbfC family nucleoid-associated protein [Candidatus Hydrogenedentota bacterium]HOV73313.1 YbaB/EbfC family nucleoid-associated protein [Candidatus Hydrogenedentota bacterium]HPC15454.1 YbaB/EbfC family nucleoid-associated protein [Candidatus Hydrogenedentota bacterium]HRT20269.1 YbaB/EbfC family nucleoid-associated protein [Candidatus Hydrogenedentota bacterium]
MFKGLENLGNLQGMFKQVFEIKSRMEEIRASLADQRIEVSAVGGMVRVVMNGHFEIVSIKIEPETMANNDIEMLETLIRNTINEAVRKTQELVKAKLAEATGGIDIPGITS